VLRALVEAVIFYVVFQALSRMFGGGGSATRTPQAPPRREDASPVKLVRDPVCGTYVSPESALSSRSSNGVAYFCSQTCRDKWLHERAS
jgi:YHS domain-containing protein